MLRPYLGLVFNCPQKTPPQDYWNVQRKTSSLKERELTLSCFTEDSRTSGASMRLGITSFNKDSAFMLLLASIPHKGQQLQDLRQTQGLRLATRRAACKSNQFDNNIALSKRQRHVILSKFLACRFFCCTPEIQNTTRKQLDQATVHTGEIWRLRGVYKILHQMPLRRLSPDVSPATCRLNWSVCSVLRESDGNSCSIEDLSCC